MKKFYAILGFCCFALSIYAQQETGLMDQRIDGHIGRRTENWQAL